MKKWEIEFQDWIDNELPVMLKEWEGRLDHGERIADLMSDRLYDALFTFCGAFEKGDSNEAEDCCE